MSSTRRAGPTRLLPLRRRHHRHEGHGLKGPIADRRLEHPVHLTVLFEWRDDLRDPGSPPTSLLRSQHPGQESDI
jgi:hypothetical protein